MIRPRLGVPPIGDAISSPLGCVATFKNQQESDWLGRPDSVSCSHFEQLVDELNLLPNIRTAHPPRLTLPDHWNAQGFLDTLEPLKIVGLKLPRGHAADVTVSPL